jgi:hypothetical protein
MIVKKGQRWLFDSEFSKTIVEVCEDADSSICDRWVNCINLQWIKGMKYATCAYKWPMNDGNKYIWTYLVGQDAPAKDLK